MTALLQPIRRLWDDEEGALLSTEYIILGTLLTLGLVVGITAARNSLVTEFEDYAAALTTNSPGLNVNPGDATNPTFVGNEGGFAYSP